MGVAAESATCKALAEQQCVFIIALGRTGSSHLLRLLNSIDGYRLSGETDNAWIYLGRFLQWSGKDTTQRRHLGRLAAGRGGTNYSDAICHARRMMTLLHNPLPRARVFGFKEIYSDLVRRSSAHSEIFMHGVEQIRTLFPRAKFIFHWRRNTSRIAASDFWQLERQSAVARRNFERLVGRFREYAAAHPDYTYETTLEGITNKSDPRQLEGLFRFLGETLVPRLRKMAYRRGGMRDWVEETHTRKIKRTLENGSVVYDFVSYAWRPEELRRRRGGGAGDGGE